MTEKMNYPAMGFKHICANGALYASINPNKAKIKIATKQTHTQWRKWRKREHAEKHTEKKELLILMYSDVLLGKTYNALNCSVSAVHK